MLMVVALNYCIFITLCVNHVLIYYKKKYVILNIPIVQDRPLYLPKFMFSSRLPLLWCWGSPCPAEVCDDSQAGMVLRTWDDASFKVASCLLWGRRRVGVEKVNSLRDITLGDQTTLAHISALSPCLIPLLTKLPEFPLCQRMMGIQPCNSMYCIPVFSKTGKNKFWKVKGMSKVKEDTSAAEGGPEAIHHWQSPSLPPDCHKASFLQAGHCPGGHLHSLLHWQKPRKVGVVASIIKLKKIDPDRSSGFPTSRKK